MADLEGEIEKKQVKVRETQEKKKLNKNEKMLKKKLKKQRQVEMKIVLIEHIEIIKML